MEFKKFNKYHFDKINEKLINKKFLTKDEVRELETEFNFCRTIMYRELLENKIIFQSSSAELLFKSLGVDLKEKKIEHYQIKKFKKWMLNLIKNTKVKIHLTCESCDTPATMQLNKFLKRNYFLNKPICSKCILKLVTNSEEWKNKNSKAQKIAQNKPGQIEKNRNAQIKRFNNTETREKYKKIGKKLWENEEYRKKMTDVAKKKWQNPEYAKKVIENSRGSNKKGFYKNLFYQSSYELAFLLKFEFENGSLSGIKRIDFSIPYVKKNKNIGYYYPDFLMNNEYIIEVKGYGPWVDYDGLIRKNKAAKKYCKNNNYKFRVVDQIDLTSYWIKKAKKIHKELNEIKE
jgi:hypothetical protein